MTSRAKWAATGHVQCPAGAFIHLCTESQLDFVLSRHFDGAEDLVLLTLDPSGLDIRWEVSEPAMPPFPHLYGDLHRASVIRIRAL